MRFLVHSLVVLAILSFGGVATAEDVSVGARIELQATSSSGVPFHSQPRPSMKGRLTDGTAVLVTELADDGHWIKVRADNGDNGWIIERYVGRIVGEALAGDIASPAVAVNSEDEASVWLSRDSCETVVHANRRMAASTDTELRIGAWNIRWFPTGGGEDKATNLEWVACAIAWLNVDVLALEEMTLVKVDVNKDGTVSSQPGQDDAVKSVLDKLKNYTGVTWAISLQECGAVNAQRVGFLYNTSRVTASSLQDSWYFNPRAENAASGACKSSMRPGRHGYFKAKKGGADLHVIAVHPKSGADEAAQTERKEFIQRISQFAATVTGADSDIVILGDMNTMGTGSAESATAELDQFETAVRALSPTFYDLPNHLANGQRSCSEYYKGKGGLLDHIIATSSSQELKGRSARTSGYCAVLQCANVSNYTANMPAAYQELSDHCPIVATFSSMDDD